MKHLLTKFQKAKQSRDKKIRKMYADLKENKGYNRTQTEAEIMNKFGIKAKSHIWRIVHKDQSKVDKGDSI